MLDFRRDPDLFLGIPSSRLITVETAGRHQQAHIYVRKPP